MPSTWKEETWWFDLIQHVLIRGVSENWKTKKKINLYLTDHLNHTKTLTNDVG